MPALANLQSVEKRVVVTRVDSKMEIDGRLDEPIWAVAPAVSNFHQIRPIEYTAPTQRTDVYVVYDDDMLYIGARLWDDVPNGVTANILRQGQRLTLDEDRFGVLISPYNDGQSGYAFYVNPNSVRDSAIFQETTFMRWEWDGIFQAAATRDEQGWYAEIAIPFKTLSFDPRVTDWGIGFQRSIARQREFIGWTSANREMNPSVLGVLEGVRGPKQGIGLDIVPAAVLKSRRTPDGGSTDYRLEPSLDVSYKLTPGLNLAATINTDFSNAAVDERQVNLTRFGLFFPEQRDFFLQDADIFEFGRLTGEAVYDSTVSRASMENGKPYFSRTIGLATDGQPVDLIGGARISGRVGGASVGAMAIRQDSYNDVDSTDLFVGRAVANVLDESTLGLLVTHGDPRTGARNSVVGADFRYRNANFLGQILQGELWYQRSDTDHNSNGREDAFGARVTIPSWTGWRGTAGIKRIGDEFRPGMGFVNRRGVTDLVAGGGYTTRFRVGGILESVFSGVDAQRFVRSSDDQIDSEAVTFRVAEMTTAGGERLTLRYISSYESLLEPFRIARDVTIPVGNYRFDEIAVRASSPSRRALYGDIGYRRGNFYEGERAQLDGRINWRPSPHYWGMLGFNVNRVDLPEGDFTVKVLQAKLGVAFSARTAWENFLQYDSVSESIGINSRFNWIPEPGQQFAMVINYGLRQEDATSRYRAAERESVLSFRYTYRF